MRLLLLIPLLLLALWLLLPRPKEAAGERPLRLNIYSEPPTLDPRKAYDITSSTVLQLLFDGLMRIGLDGEPRLSVAERVEIDESATRYTFFLRPSLWSNGDPVTAYDFEGAWKQILTPTFPADYAEQLYVIKGGRAAKAGDLPLDQIGVRALDDQRLEVELEAPIPYFLSLCASTAYFPVHRSIAALHPDWADHASSLYVANGPFLLDRWAHNSKIFLTKSPNYWDADAVQLQRVEMAMVDDERSELYLFERGELDRAGTPISVLSYDAVPSLRARGLVHSVPIAGVYWYKINTAQPPFNHSKVRRALSLAIDREQIVCYVTQGHHQPATRLIPPCLSLPGEDTLYCDPVRARQLLEEGLAELGMKRDQVPPLTISYNRSQEHQRIAQTVQRQWEESLGIKVELRIADWRVHLARLRARDFQVARQSWVATVEDPIDILQLFVAPNGSNNETGWHHPRYSELIAEASREGDQERRATLMSEAEQILLSEMPLIPIFFCDINYVVHPDLRNCCLSRLGRLDFKWAYFDH